MSVSGLSARLEVLDFANGKEYYKYYEILKNYVISLTNDEFNNELSSVKTVKLLHRLYSIGLTPSQQRYVAIHEGLLRGEV